jgi:hypothetical protein
LDQFSPRQSRPHFKIASIAAAGASQSKDRNDKQKTGFFDSIDPKPTLMGSTGRRKADIRGAPELVEFFELVRRRGDCLTRGAAAAAS